MSPRIGDVISYETSHPVIFRAVRPFETLVVQGAAGAARSRRRPEISDLTAVGISGSEGLPRAAVAFVRGLVDGLEDGTITSADAPNAVDCVLDLIRGLYTTPAGAPEPTRLRSRAEILLNVQAFIEANLGDPDLDPEEIARASFISTRYLHKLFEAEGTSVCRWIRVVAARALPPRPPRSGAGPRDDPRDREPLGPARRAALQPPVPVGVRLSAQRAPPRGEVVRGAPRVRADAP